MKVLFAASLLAAVAFGAQLVVWRLVRPIRHSRAIVLLFVGTGVVAASIAILVPSARLGLPATDLLRVGILFAAVAAAYLITYSAVEAESPTLAIILRIRAAGAAGLSPDQLRSELDDTVLVEPRIDDLVRDRLADLDDAGRYRLTGKGKTFRAIFTIQRRLLNLPVRGG